jgi:pyruvate carboxylase subunit B
VLYAIYPVTGKKFLKWKYGKEEPPAEVKATHPGAGTRPRCAAQESQGRRTGGKEKGAPEKGEAMRTFNVFVDNEYFKVGSG